jgi:aminopeptidase N
MMPLSIGPFSGNTLMKKTSSAVNNPAVRFGGTEAPTEVRLEDYSPPTHLITETHLTVELDKESHGDALVSSRLEIMPNPSSKEPTHTLRLNTAPEVPKPGTKTPTMAIQEVKLNGRVLSSQEYIREGEELIIPNLPNRPFRLETKAHIDPAANKALSGLYFPGGKFFTQCEADGFRNITPYLDRPAVLSKFTVKIVSPKGKYPYLLSNGNRSKKRTLKDGRETITWVDPHPKPSHLFALVAGDLAEKRSTFTTQSGRKTQLRWYVDHGAEGQTSHAIESLKLAMKWDEDHWGREYDLDRFQTAATNDFNYGAMENKGLNVFNSKYLLATPRIATDQYYEAVLGVVGHEYFHNWTGNRVAPRDWFQLTLKEGLTVFRDQEFTSDMCSRPVKRIDDVTVMRVTQFPEDASAMAHPIRPKAYVTVQNFYTPTVYRKGAEVIRMIHTMIGAENFRKGMDLYFKRHDGQAVTTEDFVKALHDASGVDLSQFERTWYNQSGTPTLDVRDAYDPKTKEYRLTVKQSTPATPGQPTKESFHIPIRMGLLGSNGKDMPLQLEASQANLLTNGDIVNLKNAETTFVFKNVAEKPVPSLLRNWSAPVKLNYNYSRNDLRFLMAHDSDGFNRWEAAQKLSVDVIQEMVAAHQHNQPMTVDPLLIDAFKDVLQDKTLDPALAARTLALPNAGYLAELYPDGKVDAEAIHAARKQTQQAIGKALASQWDQCFQANRSTEKRAYHWNVHDVGERAMKNTALSYLVAGNPKAHLALATAQFDRNQNMTDVQAALLAIRDNADAPTVKAKMDAFYQEHQNDTSVLDQWFMLQAMADRPDVLDQVKTLLKHPAYDAANPNRVNGLVAAFAQNPVYFHTKDGSGYQFLADQTIETDKFNPMLAAKLAKRLSTPHRFDRERQDLMKAQLERILANVQSNNVKEIVSKSLAHLAAKQAE